MGASDHVELLFLRAPERKASADFYYTQCPDMLADTVRRTGMKEENLICSKMVLLFLDMIHSLESLCMSTPTKTGDLYLFFL